MNEFDEKSMRKFVATLELLRSPVDGEVLGAAAASVRLLMSMGFSTFDELFHAFARGVAAAIQAEVREAPKPSQAQAPKTSAAQTNEDRQYAALAFRIFMRPDFRDMFNDEEKKFIEEKSTWGRSFTPKMRNWLDRLARRVGLTLDEGAAPERKAA